MARENIRIVFLGDSGVGKSTMIDRLTNNEFQTYYTPTIESNIISITRNCSDDETITFDCIDIARQVKYDQAHKIDFTTIDGVILMFDIFNKNSYKNLTFWYNKCPAGIPIVLVGNKFDENYAFQNSFRRNSLQYYEVSVKTNRNVDEALSYLLREITKDPLLTLL
jgi:GTP-binding nuclear protein Ran